MPQVNIEARRIDAEFNAEWFSGRDTAFEFLAKLGFRLDPIHAAGNKGKLFLDRSHRALLAQENIWNWPIGANAFGKWTISGSRRFAGQLTATTSNRDA